MHIYIMFFVSVSVCGGKMKYLIVDFLKNRYTFLIVFQSEKSVSLVFDVY